MLKILLILTYTLFIQSQFNTSLLYLYDSSYYYITSSNQYIKLVNNQTIKELDLIHLPIHLLTWNEFQQIPSNIFILDYDNYNGKSLTISLIIAFIVFIAKLLIYYTGNALT